MTGIVFLYDMPWNPQGTGPCAMAAKLLWDSIPRIVADALNDAGTKFGYRGRLVQPSDIKLTPVRLSDIAQSESPICIRISLTPRGVTTSEARSYVDYLLGKVCDGIGMTVRQIRKSDRPPVLVRFVDEKTKKDLKARMLL